MIDFPSNPTNGQVYANYIYDSSITAWRNVNTDTGIGTLNAMGLKNVVPTSVSVGSGSASVNANGTVTFTGASSISLNGVFTSTYTNYKMVITSSASAHNINAFLRMRNAGTDTSGSIYYFGGVGGYTSGTVTGWSGTGTNVIQWGNTAIENTTGTIDIFRPKLTERTGFNFQSFGYTSSYLSIQGAGMLYDTVSYDGATLYLSSGNFTGTITIYGYSN